jgi:Ser/Thr protein kinase RdoA (MazF antagonist)
MAGDPVTKWLARSNREDFQAQLVSAGEYLAGAHSIAFRFPGYLTTPDGPTSPLPEPGWRHPVHEASAAQRFALQLHQREAPDLSPEVRAEVERWLSRLADSVAGEYHPPRFVHGDFHAGHLWVRRMNGSWTASGAVDMEVASSGAVFEDLNAFAVEMMARFRTSTRWWEPFFFGYGSVPDLDRFRLALLATGGPSLRCHGLTRWPASMNATRRGLLAANSWSELFGVNHATD